MIPSTHHLIDDLPNSEVDTTGTGHVEIQRFIIHRRGQTTLFQHPPSTIRFPARKLGPQARLLLACGINECAWLKAVSPVHFHLDLLRENEEPKPLLHLILDPQNLTGDRGWREAQIDLSEWTGQIVRLQFSTKIAEGSRSDYCWAGWADPRLCEAPTPTPTRSRTGKAPRNVILITADALRVDHLGCYGHPARATPHLDALAEEGLQFAHARANACSTFASYVSLLTGACPSIHGVHSEWGDIPFHLPTLPTTLARHGFHTVLAASEQELVGNKRNLGRLFKESLPCFGNPAQDGSITVRGAKRWLEDRPEDPFFLWLQLFDTHPPHLPPEPWASKFYEGDPTATDRRHSPEVVRSIHGVETALELRSALPLLEQGIAEGCLRERLRSTVRALRGELDGGPDLATHLQVFPASLRRNLNDRELANWIELQISALDRGEVPQELVSWLQQIFADLQVSEEAICGWLRGVEDVRYPKSLYLASVSYFDALCGEIFAALRALGLWEESLVIVLSPHGEGLDETRQPWEHHHLSETILRVPMLVKPPGSISGLRRGAVQQPIDLIDVAPTLLEWLGIAAPERGPKGYGIARCPATESQPTEQGHRSIAVSMPGLAMSILSEPYKLIVSRETMLLNGELWHAGERRLYDLRRDPLEQVDISKEHPELVSEMAQLLPAWPNLLHRKKGLPSNPSEGCRSAAEQANGSVMDPEAADGPGNVAHELQVTREALKKESERVDQYARETRQLRQSLMQLSRWLTQMESALELLYRSKRWRVANPMRLARRLLSQSYEGKLSYGPAEKVVERFRRWQTRNAWTLTPDGDSPESLYTRWVRLQTPGSARCTAWRNRIPFLRLRPIFVLVTPLTAQTRVELVKQMLGTVRDQVYPDWQLVFLRENDCSRNVIRCISQWARKDARIRILTPSEWPKSPVDRQVFFSYHGAEDLLQPHALMLMAEAINEAANVDLLYADDDRVTEDGLHGNPLFKPAWSPDTLFSFNYVGTFCFFREGWLEAEESWRQQFYEGRIYELLLRATERATSAHHVQAMLVHHRLAHESTLAQRRQQRLETEVTAVQKTFAHAGLDVQVQPTPEAGTFRITRLIRQRQRVTIIIPTRNRADLLRRCLHSIAERTRYEHYEVLIVDHESTEEEARTLLRECGHQVMTHRGPFNYSAMMNAAASKTENPWLLFLNNDTEIITPEWICAMAEHVQRPEIGAVGAKLLFPDGTLQHAGIEVGVNGTAHHLFFKHPGNSLACRGMLQTIRDCSAVTAACLMTRRELFLSTGGFDARRFAVAYNDVEYCLRLRSLGYRVLYTPFACLYHHESATRSRHDDPGELERIRELVARFGSRDPFAFSAVPPRVHP